MENGKNEPKRTQLNAKFRIDDQVWTEDTYGYGGVMQGIVIGILFSKSEKILYMLSSDRHRCHTHPEEDVFMTQEQAWANWKDVAGKMRECIAANRRGTDSSHKEGDKKKDDILL